MILQVWGKFLEVSGVQITSKQRSVRSNPFSNRAVSSIATITAVIIALTVDIIIALIISTTIVIIIANVLSSGLSACWEKPP